MKTIFALLLLCFIGDAYAGDLYMTAGFGQARMRMVGTNDLWQISGYDMVKEEKSNAWKVGVGLRLNRYLSAELDYRDLGQFNNDGIFIDDNANAPGNYNNKTGRCNGQCDPSIAGWQHGTTRGIGLSLVAGPDWTIAPYVRAGAFYHFSKFTSIQMRSHDQNTNKFVVGYEPVLDKGIGPMGGIGIRAGWLSIEYDFYAKAASTDSPYSNISTILVNISKEF